MTGGKGHLRCILTGGTGETRDDKDKQPGPVTAAAYYFFFGSIDGVLRGFLVHVPEGVMRCTYLRRAAILSCTKGILVFLRF